MELFSHSWLPLIYLYSLGGVLFLSGIIITVRAGSFDLSKHTHAKWMWILVFGFIWYAGMHILMTLAALNIISVYVVPIILLGLVSIFIIIIVTLRNKAKA